MLGIGVAIILVVILLVVLGNRNKKSDNTLNLKPGTITGPFYEQKDYPRKEIGASIADAMAVTMNKSDNVVKTTKGAVILPACAVLTLTDVNQAGLRTQASSLAGSIEMNYVDGQGSGIIPFDGSSLPFDKKSNECRYTLQDGLGSVTLDVYQPYITSANAIQDQIDRQYEKAPAIAGVSGVELFVRKAGQDSSASEKRTTEYIVRKSADVSFYLRVETEKNRKTSTEKLIKTVLGGIDKLTKTPEGAPRPTYKNSPTYKQAYLRACSFLDDEGMKKLAGVPAAAFVSEQIAQATGVATFKEFNDNNFYVYVENVCEREGTGQGIQIGGGTLYNSNPTMRLKTTSYSDKKAAAYVLQYAQKHVKDGISVPNVGDEAIVNRDSVNENHFIFRKDRFVIDMTYDTLSQKQKGIDDQNKYAEALIPYAQYIVQELK